MGLDFYLGGTPKPLTSYLSRLLFYLNSLASCVLRNHFYCGERNCAFGGKQYFSDILTVLFRFFFLSNHYLFPCGSGAMCSVSCVIYDCHVLLLFLTMVSLQTRLLIGVLQSVPLTIILTLSWMLVLFWMEGRNSKKFHGLHIRKGLSGSSTSF